MKTRKLDGFCDFPDNVIQYCRRYNTKSCLVYKGSGEFKLKLMFKDIGRMDDFQDGIC